MKSISQVFTSKNSDRKFLFGYLLIFLTYIVLLPKTGHDFDTYCWKEWAKYIFTNGLGNAYKSGTDYLPLYQYFLYFFGLLQGSIENIERNIYLLKIFTLIFDFIGGFFLVKMIKEKISNPYEWFFYSMFFFMNIAVFYNTLIWGQVDGIMSTFLFITVYFALKEKVLLSLLFLLLAINMKLQAIIFLPIVGLILLPLLIKEFSFRNLSKWVLSIVALQLLILLPFIIKGDFQKIISVITGSFGKYPVVSMNAHNLWTWFIKGILMTTPDNLLFMGITYKSWGLLLFFTTSFVALWPLLKTSTNRLLGKSRESTSTEKILIISALIPLLFFFFNTQMHERYSHPALIFIITYSILSKNFLPSIIICSAYFLNIEDVQHYLQLDNYRLLFFRRHIIAIIYFIGILLLFFKLYQNKNNQVLHS